MGWQQTLQEFLPFLFYGRCPICDRTCPQILCPSCQQHLQSCKLEPKQLPQVVLPSHLSLLAWGYYQGSLKQAIAALKYEPPHPRIALLLGEMLAQAWFNQWLSQGKSAPALTVVPIPLHAEKLKTRGFNQAELIAQSFCRATGLEHKPNGLERVRPTEPQFSLSLPQRQQNLCQAFALGQDFRAKRPTHPILLLDDIYTTGATTNSALAVLQGSGIEVYGIATVALTPQRQSPTSSPTLQRDA
jgi:ComF family protein